MTQAQTASGTLSPVGQPPQRGYRLRDFELFAVDGRQVRPSDFRAHANLVLIFAGVPATAMNLLEEVAQRKNELQAEEAQVIAIVQATLAVAAELANTLKVQIPLLVDEHGSVHREFGAAAHDGVPAPAIYITDRYGEVFGSFRTAIGQRLPTFHEILSWLSFVNSQCPECESPEWPL